MKRNFVVAFLQAIHIRTMQKPFTARPFIWVLFFFSLFSCARKSYVASNFEEVTSGHTVVAILPAEMIFTGKQPKDLSQEDISKMEEQESTEFQVSLYNSVLRHANTRKYVTTVNFQDINTTLRLLEENKISVRDSWKLGDKELSRILEVHGVVRMQVRKQRYMSDKASYAIHAGTRILNRTGLGSKIPVPSDIDKTNEIFASCNLVTDGMGLWNDHYKAAADWNNPANKIIENITDEFGSNFPYKRKKR